MRILSRGEGVVVSHGARTAAEIEDGGGFVTGCGGGGGSLEGDGRGGGVEFRSRRG